MKFLVAIDSFKGSVSAAQACAAVKSGILRAMPHATVVEKPIADGGEGTLEAMVPRDQRREVEVSGPLFEKISAQYGAVGDTAVIEMASAAGLTLVKEKDRNAGRTTTYGAGELILHALRGGFRKIMLTAGGSATNDGGCGMLAALGAVFRDADGREFLPTGDSLGRIAEVELSGMAEGFFDCEFTVATDVKNPLLGENGATFVYAPQKGLTEGQKERLETGMRHYSALIEQLSGIDVAVMEGAGAGGGIAVPLLAFAKTKISSGIDTVLDVVDFSAHLADTDAVITGEGRLDVQSLYGKAISGVTTRAAAHGVPVYCFVGCVGDDEESLRRMGIRRIYTVASRASSTEDSMQNAATYLSLLAEEFVRGLS